MGSYLLHELFGTSRPILEENITPVENIELSYQNVSRSDSLGDGLSKELVEFAVIVSSSVSINLFSSWIYDKIKKKSEKCWINDIEVEISEHAIKNIIDRIVESENRR